MPAAHTDAARPHTNQPCCYCVSIVRWIRSVCFFRTWTCGQETVNVHGKGAGRHPRLNSTGDPFLTGLPCSGTVNSLTQLWNAPSVSSQGKLYICLAHPRVLRVPTVLLIQTRAPIVIFARAHPDSSVSPSGSISLRRCSPNEAITEEIGNPAASREGAGGSRRQSGPNRGVIHHMGIMPPAGTAPRKFYTRSSPASETKQRSACYVHENPSPLPSRITFRCYVSSIVVPDPYQLCVPAPFTCHHSR